MCDRGNDPQTRKYSCRSQLQYKSPSEGKLSGGKWNGAHAFHGSKEVNLLISIPGRCRLERTTSQFSCGEYRTLCYGLLMDPMERAIRRHCPAIGFLK